MAENGPSARSDRPLAAFGWMILSGVGFTAMSTMVKRLSHSGVSQAELTFHRSWVNFAVVLALMLVRREKLIASQAQFLLIGRGVAGFCGLTCLFYALSHLPLPIASLLNWSSPIFVLLFSRLFLRETIPSRTIPGMLLAFLGVVVLLAPGLGGGADSAGPADVIHSLPPLAIGIGVLGAAFGGLAYVVVRAASARVSANTIVLYFTGTATLLSLPAAAFEGFERPPGVFGDLLLLGTFAAIGQLAMTRAYRLAPAAQVSAMGLMNAVLSAFAGWYFFGEVLSSKSWAGALLTAGGVAFLALAHAVPRGARVKSVRRWAMLDPWN